ncbi:MAG: zinc metalloprotease HtpX [Candidatus Levybacteria bacterium RBG_16_35_11]|nr:MAG: zinc metalloprotease HtpX [Candidatus Levybacteria bacterium RBG_16_35_11]
MFLFVIFITTIVYVFGKALGYGWPMVGFALILAGVTSFSSYYYSDKLVLATVKAKAIEKKDNPELFRIVENLAIGDGLPKPKIYIINDPSPNAFATGRDPNHAVVCATTGLLEKLNRIELEGVISHELSHVKNYDTRLMAIVTILVGFVVIAANFFTRSLWFSGGRRDREGGGNIQLIFLLIGIVFAILSPIIATLIQLAVSRKREYLADASGALLTRYPDGLASALEKISADRRPVASASNANAHLFIVNPFRGKDAKAWFSSLFDTHPPVAERIKILRSM